MGLIAKQQTKNLVQPVTLPLGAWLASVREQFPQLDEQDLFGMTAAYTALSADISRAMSSTLGSGRFTPSQIANSQRHSLLRMETLHKQVRFALGSTDGRGAWHADWTMALQRADGLVQASVVDYRTREDSVPNKKLIGGVRDLLVGAVNNGVPLQRRPGLPQSENHLVQVPLDHAKSPFANDYLLAPGPAFQHGARMPLPTGATDKLVDTWRSACAPLVTTAAGGLALDLSGGRRMEARLQIGDAQGDALVFDCPGFASAGLMGQHRTFRAAMFFLLLASRLLADSQSDLSAALAQLVWYSGDDQLDQGRLERMIPVWAKDLPMTAVPARLAGGFPVAMAIRARHIDVPALLTSAQGWLSVRQRTWTTGVRKASRAANRVNGSRRSYRLVQQEKRLPYVRYGQLLNTSAGTNFVATADASWYWEVRLRPVTPPQGADPEMNSALLTVTGIGQGDGLVAYGTELLAFFRSVGFLVSCKDPSAQFETYYVGA